MFSELRPRSQISNRFYKVVQFNIRLGTIKEVDIYILGQGICRVYKTEILTSKNKIGIEKGDIFSSKKDE